MGRSLASLVVAAVGALVVVAPAAATLPGRNGALVLLSVEGGRDYYTGSIVRVGARGRPLRRREVCGYSYVWNGPFHPACSSLDGLALSPDGRGVTLLAGTIAREQDELYTRSVWIEDLAFGGPERWRWPLAAQGPAGVRYDYSGVAWSSDGRQLLVARNRTPPAQTPNDAQRSVPDGIELFDANGQTHGQIVGGGAREPDWSARGEIAFIAGGNPPLRAGDLYRTRPGLPAIRLTTGGASDPSWSPDGTKLAFVRRCPPLRQLITDDPCTYVMRAEGGKPRLLARRASDPVWSPDGTRIALLRPYLPRGQDPNTTGRALYVTTPRTGRQRRLTPALDNLDAGYGASDLTWLTRH
jgi:dipeptidyl aminopeptidase/acylaminoacyl peptidase